MTGLGARLNEINRYLLEGSRTASLDLFREALRPLTGYVVRSVSSVTAEEARDHAVEAIIGHIHNPGAFDAAKSSLWSFLCMVAQRNALDAARQKGDRRELMKKHGYDIELWPVQANTEIEDVEWRKDAERIMLEHGATLAQNEGERRVLDLMLEGERSVPAYTSALGLDPSDDAAEEVKRVKDRIKLRMRKLGDALG